MMSGKLCFHCHYVRIRVFRSPRGSRLDETVEDGDSGTVQTHVTAQTATTDPESRRSRRKPGVFGGDNYWSSGEDLRCLRGRSEPGNLHFPFPQRNATGQGALNAREVPVRYKKSGFTRVSNLEVLVLRTGEQSWRHSCQNSNFLGGIEELTCFSQQWEDERLACAASSWSGATDICLLAGC